MSSKHSRIPMRILALVIALCMIVQAVPLDVFAAEIQMQQAEAEVEKQKENVAELEEEVNTLLEEQNTRAADIYELAVVEEEYVITVDGKEVVCGTFEIGIQSNLNRDFYLARLYEYKEADTAPEHYEVVIPEMVVYEANGTTYDCYVEIIGNSSFKGNTSITGVSMSEYVETISSYAFQDCSALSNVTLSENLVEIDAFAFANCTSLTAIGFPETLTAIRGDAFVGCEALEIDASEIMGLPALETIGTKAFMNTGVYGELKPPAQIYLGLASFSNTKITKLDLTSSPDRAMVSDLAKDCALLTEVVFHPETTEIYGSLAENTAVTKVFIPKTVTSVGGKAFKNCPITEITFEPREDNVDLTIGVEAFYGNKLTSFTFPTMHDDADLALQRECFAGSDMTTLILDERTTACQYIKCVSPFSGQPIRNVTLPKLDMESHNTDVIFIPEGLFQESGITSTEFLEDSDVASIGDYAFADCDQLVTFTNGLNCNGIGAYAFQGCDSLTTLENMDLIGVVGDYAFANCDSLEQLEFWTESERRESGSFYWGVGFVSGCDKLKTIVIHGTGYLGGSPSENSTKVRWDDVLPFKGCNSLEFVFDGGITTVGASAFAGAKFIKNLDFLPESVTEYERYAFAYSGLEEVTISSHITLVDKAFPFCENLASLTVENDLEAWEWMYVDEEEEADGFTWDDGADANSYFDGAPLRSPGDDYVNVTLPKSWTTLPEAMFYGTDIIDTRFLEKMPRLTNIPAYAFANCDVMEEITIPNTVESIGYRAFYNSVATVSTLTIPYSVKTLETRGEYGWAVYQQFYDEDMSGTLLEEVRIYNPELNLNEFAYLLDEDGNLVDSEGNQVYLYDQHDDQYYHSGASDIYESYIFNYGHYSEEAPLILSGSMESTALSLVAKDGGSYLAFSPLEAAEKVTVTVLLPDGSDNTYCCEITWMDETGNVIATGSEFRPPVENETFYYTVKLDDWDCWTYQTPAKGKITSSVEQGEEIVITLEEIGTTTITGKLVDENGNPVPDAEVLLDYVSDDRKKEAGLVYTDENGVFALEDVKDMRTEIRADMYGYYTGTAVYLGGEGKETIDVGTIKLQKLPGTTAQLVIEVMSADGSNRTLKNMNGLTFTVTDGITGERIPCKIQNNILILDGEAILQDRPLRLKVTTTEESKLVAPSEAVEFTLGEGAYITLKEYGAFSLEAASADAVGQYVWAFQDGNLVESYEMNGGIMTSAPLKAGEYTLVVMDRTAPIMNPANVESITKIGLKSGTHFYQTNVTINDGEMCSHVGFTVPRLDENALDLLYTDMFESVTLSSSVRSPMAGQEYHLIVDYKLKDEYIGSGEKTFTFALPQGTKLLDIYTPGVSDAYEPEIGTSTHYVEVHTTEAEGYICLAVMSTEPVEGACTLTLSYQNKLCAQKELNYRVAPAEVKLHSYSEMPADPYDYSMIVKAVPESKVELYVDDVLAATSYANLAGSARFTINLPLPAYTGREWRIYAIASFDGVSVMSEEVKVSQAGDPLNPVITLNGNHKFYINDPAKSTENYIVNLEATGVMDEWTVDVKEGEGGKILNGVIYINFRNSFNDESYQIPCYRVGKTDTFRGQGSAKWYFDYMSLRYEMTDAYWEELGQEGTRISEDSILAYEQEFDDLLAQYGATQLKDEAYLQKLEDDQMVEVTPIDQIPEFQALSEEEQQEILKQTAEDELKLKAAQEANERIAEEIFGRSIDWDVDSAEELLEQVGYTSRELEPGELKEIQNDSKYLPMMFGSDMIYYYADEYETITVDAAANTITTMALPAVASASYSTRASGSEESKNAQIVDTALNAITTTYSQMSNGIDIEISVLEKTTENYATHLAKHGFEHPDAAAATARLAALKAMKKALPIINNLLSVGTVLGMANELWNISDNLDRLRSMDKSDMKADCLQATNNLIAAYEELSWSVFRQAMSAIGQMLATLGSTALAAFSRLASVAGLVVSSIGGLVVDLYFGYLADQAKAKAQQAQRIRASVCDDDEEEDEEDEDKDGPEPGEIPTNPGVNPPPKYDPAGYVYEAVFSNPVEGATVTTYYNDNGTATVWDAEAYDQVNPLITTAEGFYQWFVPLGEWKVVAEKEGYKTADTTEIYAKLDEENDREDIVNGWHTVLPEQTEVHIPLESTEAPQVKETAAYTEGIGIIFSQYMKENITVTVTQNGTTYSGDDLELVWLDREYSDHYYNEWFASELSIRLKNGEWAVGEATVNITNAVNYAGTDLAEYNETLSVLSAPANVEAADMEIPFCDEKQLVVTVTDKNGNPVAGVTVEAQSKGYAKLKNDKAVTDENGEAIFDVEGYAVGQGKVTLSIVGTDIQKDVTVTVTHDNAMYIPDAPIINIGSESYKGQDNSITVAKGTKVTIVGNENDQYFYSIGEDSCPCEADDQVEIKNQTMTLEESGYYKFAAYSSGSGEYSERVHISVLVTEEIPDEITEIVMKVDHLPPEIGEGTYPATLYSINGITDSNVLDIMYYANAVWRYSRYDREEDTPEDYTGSMMYDDSTFGQDGHAYSCLDMYFAINSDVAGDTTFSEDLEVILLTADGKEYKTERFERESDEWSVNYFYRVIAVEPAPRYENVLTDSEDGYLLVDYQSAKAGQTITITGVPYNEYWTTEDVSVVLSDGTSVEVTKTEENTFTFVQPEGVVTISATFGPKSTETYSIRVIQPEEGATITLVQTEPQMAGTEITFNVQVENGFELYYCDIMDENGEMLSYYENLNEEYRAYSFIMPDSDVTISIHVEVLKYWIWGSVYGDGEWNEGGSLVVMPERPRLGETVSVIVAPERGYKLESLVLYYWDNEIWEMVEITPVQVNENYYTFTQPNEDVNIEAYFVSAAVNVKQPSNGTITVEPESPAVDDIVIITVAPDAGYVADSVTVKDRDGNEVETEKVKDGIYTYKQPEGQVTISATMVEKEYQILVDEVVNGKVSVSHELAKAGTKVTVNVTPDDGYKLTSVSAVNAKGEALTLVEEDGVYTFTQPKSNVTVAAVFEKADASAVLLGDITLDGTVDMADLVMMLRVIVKRVSVEDLTSEQILAGDVIDGDGEITMADLVKMLRYIVKRIPSLE